jgi:hypothetical protein
MDIRVLGLGLMGFAIAMAAAEADDFCHLKLRRDGKVLKERVFCNEGGAWYLAGRSSSDGTYSCNSKINPATKSAYSTPMKSKEDNDRKSCQLERANLDVGGWIFPVQADPKFSFMVSGGCKPLTTGRLSGLPDGVNGDLEAEMGDMIKEYVPYATVRGAERLPEQIARHVGVPNRSGRAADEDVKSLRERGIPADALQRLLTSPDAI